LTPSSPKPPIGDVVSSGKPESWAEFLALSQTMTVPEDFMKDRDQESAIEPDLF
jgi:hypothetical protein